MEFVRIGQEGGFDPDPHVINAKYCNGYTQAPATRASLARNCQPTMSRLIQNEGHLGHLDLKQLIDQSEISFLII